MFAVTAAEFTAEGTANILVNRFIPRWGCPSTLLSDNGLQFCAQFATAVYELIGIHKLTTSAYHPSGNGGVERVNHTVAQMLAMVCNEHQSTGMHIFLMSNTLIIIQLARPQASPRTKCISDTYRASS